MARPAKPQASTFAGQIGALVRARRLRKRLSVEAAAEAAGATASVWYAWEHGRSMRLEALPRIAAALGCRARQLLPADIAAR